MAPSRRPARPPASRVAALSHRLEDLLREAERRAPAPPGTARCPACGLALLPTRNRRVRVHDDPLSGRRCAAAGRAWAEWGKRVPKVPPARKGPPCRTRRRRR